MVILVIFCLVYSQILSSEMAPSSRRQLDPQSFPQSFSSSAIPSSTSSTIVISSTTPTFLVSTVSVDPRSAAQALTMSNDTNKPVTRAEILSAGDKLAEGVFKIVDYMESLTEVSRGQFGFWLVVIIIVSEE